MRLPAGCGAPLGAQAAIASLGEARLIKLQPRNLHW